MEKNRFNTKKNNQEVLTEDKDGGDERKELTEDGKSAHALAKQTELLKQLKRKETRTARKRKKMEDGQAHIEHVRTYAQTKRIIVGIDMSQNSPAMCILDRQTNTCRCVALPRLQAHYQPTFVERLRTPHTMTTVHNVSLSFWIELLVLRKESKDNKEKETESDPLSLKVHDAISWKEHLTNALLDCLSSYAPSDTYIVLEGYSYNKQRTQGGSSSVTDLAEITGVLKCKLLANGFEMDIVPPTTIKSWFIKGSAGKTEMYDHFHAMQEGINLDSLFGFETDKQWKEIPSPQQDIVDAFACGYSLFVSTPSSYLQAKQRKGGKAKRAKIA